MAVENWEPSDTVSSHNNQEVNKKKGPTCAKSSVISVEMWQLTKKILSLTVPKQDAAEHRQAEENGADSVQAQGEPAGRHQIQEPGLCTK